MLEETMGDVGEALSGDTAHWRTGRVYIPALSIARFGGPQGRCAPRTIDAITWESGRETRVAREGRRLTRALNAHPLSPSPTASPPFSPTNRLKHLGCRRPRYTEMRNTTFDDGYVEDSEGEGDMMMDYPVPRKAVGGLPPPPPLPAPGRTADNTGEL